jgi:hypothetical protein
LLIFFWHLVRDENPKNFFKARVMFLYFNSCSDYTYYKKTKHRFFLTLKGGYVRRFRIFPESRKKRFNFKWILIYKIVICNNKDINAEKYLKFCVKSPEKIRHALRNIGNVAYKELNWSHVFFRKNKSWIFVCLTWFIHFFLSESILAQILNIIK